MRRFFQIICLITFGIILTTGFPLQSYTEGSRGSGGISQDIQTQRIQNLEEKINLGEIPLYFIPNTGQMDKQALFYSRMKEYTLWCTQSGLVFDSLADNGLRAVSALNFKGARKAEVVPVNMADYTVSYLKGKNSGEWNAGIQTSRAVLYKDLYEKIDLKLFGNKSQIEYDWIVKKGGDASQIEFAIDGANSIRISESGDLVVETAGGQLVHTKPYAYQNIEGEQRVVDAAFVEVEKRTYGFDIGEYNPKYDLIIDPLLVYFYSSFLGGTEIDQAWDITVDSKGRAYITGFTASTDFPTTSGVYNPNHNGAMDVFVTKFNKTGTDLVYSTFIGGSSSDWSYGIAVDADGFIFIAGGTASADFPIKGGAYDTSHNGEIDAFVAKLNRNGNDLLFSTFIGGSNEDIGYDIVLGADGELFITGSTDSINYPTTKGAASEVFGGLVDGFATKFDSEASKLIYSTYLGEQYVEELFGIAVDKNGAAYVTGYVDVDGSGDDDSDVWAVKLDNKGANQKYSFIFGGGDDESGRAVVVDDVKKAYIVGWTYSSNFPTTPEAFDPTYNGHSDAFVCKLKQDGTDFVYCSYLGGTCWDWGEDIDLYDDLSAVVTGYTTTGDFPVTDDAFDPTHNGSADAFVSYVSPDGRDLPYSTFLGGREPDYGTGIAVDVFEITHTTGYTESANFPSTPDAYQPELNNAEGISDGYYVKFAREWPISLEITNPSPLEGVAGIVSIQTEVIADGDVAWVKFYINKELLSTDTTAPYTYDWDTASYPNWDPVDIKVRASDTADHRVYATTSVIVLNGTLELQAQRGEYEAWLSRKPFVELTMDVQSSETMDRAYKFLFLRQKEGETDIDIVRTVLPGELQGSTATATDLALEEGAVYTYWAIALEEETEESPGETVVGISEKTTL